jgi:glycosyltransferase involved in cell wall biosynthesis
MKIVHIITRFMRGGADENTLLSCNAQVAIGHEVHLLYGGEYSDAMLENLDERVVRYRVESLMRPVSPFNDLAALIKIVSIIRSIQPDIVHTHTSKAGIIGRAAAVISGVKGIVHGVHILPFVNVGPFERFIYLALERSLAPATRSFVNVSEGMLSLGLQYGVGRRERHCVIASGMDVSLYREAKAFSFDEMKQRLGGEGAGAALLVFVAALEPRKRQYDFLDVFQAVLREVPAARLVLLGEGVDENRLRARSSELGVSDSVSFLGFSSEAERWIASASVCVFASEREGLPRAVIQYAMAGSPIVSTRLPGIERVVIDGETGVLVDVDSLPTMVQPIVEYLRDPGRAKHVKALSRKIDFSPWEVSSMVEQLECVYEDVR